MQTRKRRRSLVENEILIPAWAWVVLALLLIGLAVWWVDSTNPAIVEVNQQVELTNKRL